MEPAKRFALRADQIRQLVVNGGACFATDKITVEGLRVGYMYREASDIPIDSGWRFFSGTESQAYVDDPKNTSIYDVNTVANYDPEVIPFLDAPIGAEFERSNESGGLVPVDPLID